MRVCTRISGLLAVAVGMVLGAAPAAGEEARRPIVYDVTVAGLEDY